MMLVSLVMMSMILVLKKGGVEELTIIRFRFLRFLLLRRYFLWNQYH